MYTGKSLARAENARVEDRQRRLLALALLVSLVLHALILFFFSSLGDFSQSRVAPSPLIAHLAKPKPPLVEPQPRLPLTRKVPNAKPQTQPPPVAAPAPVVMAAPAPDLAAPAQRVASAEIQPAPAAASGPDAASVARYRLELMEIATRYERYPGIARENGWEGRVELRIAFAASGAIASMSVKQGSGRAVLDEEAQAMFRSAQPHAVIPPALRGRAFVLETSVIFRLKK